MEGTQKKIGWERPLVGGQLSLCPRAGEQAGSGGTGSSLRGPLQPCSAPVAALVWVRGGEGGAFALRAAAGAIRDETLRGLRPSLLPGFCEHVCND